MRILYYWLTVGLNVPGTPKGTFQYELAERKTLREVEDASRVMFDAILEQVKASGFSYVLNEQIETPIERNVP